MVRDYFAAEHRDSNSWMLVYLLNAKSSESLCESPDHHDPRRTEPALTAIPNCYSLLHWMGILTVPNPFDCYDMFSIDTDQRRKASVDRSVVDFLGGRVEMGNNLQQKFSNFIPPSLVFTA
jgi:hypothetical protein